MRRNVKKKKQEEEQKKRPRGALRRFLSASRPTATAVNPLVSAEAEPGPEMRQEDAVEEAVGCPSTSAAGGRGGPGDAARRRSGRGRWCEAAAALNVIVITGAAEPVEEEEEEWDVTPGLKAGGRHVTAAPPTRY